MTGIQSDLFTPTLQQQFDDWKLQPGSRQVLRRAHAIASIYGARYVRTGQRASVRLVWELLRDRVKEVRLACRRRGVDLAKWQGYTLNDHFHAYVSRHIVSHHPEYAGMFETRTLGKKRNKRKVIVIQEPTC